MAERPVIMVVCLAAVRQPVRGPIEKWSATLLRRREAQRHM